MATVIGARLCQFVLKSLEQSIHVVRQSNSSALAVQLKEITTLCCQLYTRDTRPSTSKYMKLLSHPGQPSRPVPTLKESSLWQHGPT